MTEAQKRAAKRRAERESLDICPTCSGTGRVTSKTISTRGRKGGNATYLKSLQSEELSMRERGKLGGRPRELTLADLLKLEDENQNRGESE